MMRRDENEGFTGRLPSIEKDVMSYLLRHPDAKDTVRGIMQWWLPRTYPGLTAIELTGTLDALVQKGWLTATSHIDGATIYGLDRKRRAEIVKGLES